MTRVISVVGTAGGVGASMFATMLALRASALGAAVVAVDARPFGGGLDVHFGLDEDPGLRWPDLADAAGTLDGLEIFGRLPMQGRCGVLSFDRTRPVVPSPEALHCVVRGLSRISDIVVLDAPRAGEIWEEPVADLSDDVIAVTGTTIPALTGAAASVAHLDAVHDGVWLVARTERGSTDLPGRLADALDLPLLGAVPTDPRVVTAMTDGHPPSSKGGYAKAVDHILTMLHPMRRIA